MNSIEAIAEIKEHGFHEVHHKTLFKCYRSKDGGIQEVEIEILDAGPEVNKRYHCTARIYKDGKIQKRATGNPGATVGNVLYTLHWQDLD